MEKVGELWAQYGKLQAKREFLSNELNNVTSEMRRIYGAIRETESRVHSNVKTGGSGHGKAKPKR